MSRGRGGKTPRNKGRAYENRVAKILTRFFELEKEDCYRTPLSGGHRFDSKLYPNDLVKSDKLRVLFPFSISCKDEKWIKTMDGKIEQWLDWYEEANTALNRSDVKGELPIVITHEQGTSCDWVVFHQRVLLNDMQPFLFAGRFLLLWGHLAVMRLDDFLVLIKERRRRGRGRIVKKPLE